MNLELPKALVLWSKQNDHVGFMLLSIEQRMQKGECVFMLSPSSIEGIESQMGIVVSELKEQGEHNFSISLNESGINICVEPTDLPVITFKLNNEFAGDVFTEFDGKVQCIGSVEPAKKNA